MRDLYIGKYPENNNLFTTYIYPLQTHGSVVLIESAANFETACDIFERYCDENKGAFQADITGPNGFRKVIW